MRIHSIADEQNAVNLFFTEFGKKFTTSKNDDLKTVGISKFKELFEKSGKTSFSMEDIVGFVSITNSLPFGANSNEIARYIISTQPHIYDLHFDSRFYFNKSADETYTLTSFDGDL